MAVKTPWLILYHIPKCGGSHAKEAMRRSMPHPETDYGRARLVKGYISEFGLYREHATPDMVIEEDKRGRLSICFVRNPITWYRSFWAFRIKTKSYDPDFPCDLLMDNNYENFINNVLDAYPNGFVTQLYKYYVGEDLSEINFIGKQETLMDDFVEALTLSGQEFDEKRLRGLKRLRVAGSDPKLDDVTRLKSATIDKIMNAEEWVFNTFYKDV